MISSFINQLGMRRGPKDPSAYITLLKIIPEKRRNITELAEACGVTKSYALHIVKTLEENGIVKKMWGGRSRYVVLSDAGEEILRGLEE